jgi:hypothetical protein
MPEHLLLAFLDNESYDAHMLLARFADERGFELSELTQAVEGQVRIRRAANVDFDFVDKEGVRVALGDEMLKVLDEGLAIARSRAEVLTDTEDALAEAGDHAYRYDLAVERRGSGPAVRYT